MPVLTVADRSSRAMISAGEICGIDTIGFAMASPDAAIAPARPVFLRFGDLVDPDVLAEFGAGLVGAESFIDRRRNSLRFFVVLLTEYTDAASELSGAASRAELGMLGTVALVLRPCFGGARSINMLFGLIFVGDSTMGDIVSVPSSPTSGVPDDVGGDVAARSCFERGGGDATGLLSRPSLMRSPLRLDLADLFDLSDGVRRSSCSRSKPVATVADRGCAAPLPFAGSFRLPVELECESGRRVDSRSDMFGRLGVGVTASSSSGDTGMGLLPSESVCCRRGFFPFRSSADWLGLGVCDPLDVDIWSLFRGEGGTTVTLGLIESLSVSDRWLLSELEGLCVLGLDMDMIGCLGSVGDVGDGEGERVASRLWLLVLTSLEKKLGGMAPAGCADGVSERGQRLDEGVPRACAGAGIRASGSQVVGHGRPASREEDYPLASAAAQEGARRSGNEGMVR